MNSVYLGLSRYSRALRGWRFSVVKKRLVSLLRSLKARSRLVVKFFLASSRLAVNRCGTGPSKLSLSNKFVVRGHSAKSTVATAPL